MIEDRKSLPSGRGLLSDQASKKPSGSKLAEPVVRALQVDGGIAMLVQLGRVCEPWELQASSQAISSVRAADRDSSGCWPTRRHWWGARYVPLKAFSVKLPLHKLHQSHIRRNCCTDRSQSRSVDCRSFWPILLPWLRTDLFTLHFLIKHFAFV